MKTKHTPGEWEYFKSKRGYYVASKKDVEPAFIECFDKGEETNEANAKLIAAAPELLEQLIKAKEVILFLESQTKWKRDPSAMDKIDAIIKKATE